ncbi:Fanconi anemia group I protein-like [Mizuhopecten yessoensis]|uniref:Fanconi anemia group I protein-like n=1 Tax=Mizuhopecten yessoensis TaxID=6573 RepID=A0A210PPP4_MIZYE|nr:Fanconi anemia group I protein-like [Mizuhopecten yessoensis]XP_021378387.1 Fanconi anemia group I protein-like [Mizuhopecten yessoensis]XP_021378388.1 Fanconi anemia group I protein-like [Mizuhopecten yessoensis]OWF38448.1 Fanconi anemia group I protein-like [Mizuhopecten yessoensis]
MEKKLIKLCEDGQSNELAKTVQEIPNQELNQMVENRALRGKGEVLPLLQAILQGISATEPRNVKKCVSVYTHCINLLERNEMSNKDASNVVGLLMLEVDGLPGTALTELSSLFIDLVKNGQAQCGKGLELLPKLLSALANEETVIYGDNSMSGTEFKGHILNSLCACRWNAQSVIHLAGMFKDVIMTLDELKFVMEKMLRMLKELEHADLPALVYQLLLLSVKGHQRLVIEGITNFFIEQDKHLRGKSPNELSEDLMEDDNEETVRHIEGTIILHVSFATKLDHNLGKEFIKFLKSQQQGCTTQVLAPFNLALALSLSCIHRFEDQVFDFLKVTILKSFKDCDKQDQSAWVREVVPQSCRIQDLVLETVQNSVYGWDHVIHGLVQLGFVLMDSFGPKAAAFGRLEDTTNVPSNTPSHRACQLGSKILLHTFKAHEMVRVDILEHIFNRVVTKATSPVSHYLELLASTVMSAPQILLESTPKVREMFDYLSFLTPTSAEGLLKAIQPLLKFSMSLKDALILVLRKAMFSRQLDSRKIGVNGFLMILKHFRVLGGLQPSQASQSVSSSQIQVDVHARYNPSSNEALCLEIMGNLRRVLTQQADVRLVFYEGIYRVLCRNSQLQGPILDILLSQLKKYYEPSEDVNPPMKLDMCICAQGDQVYLQEPLAHLLGCVQLSLLKISDIRRQQTEDEPEDETHILAVKSELEDMLESITRRMVKSEMEDFELDKAADFSLGNSVGVKNNIFAILVLGTYEVLMEYTFLAGQFSMNSIGEVLELYENYHKLGSVLKEKANAAAGKKGKGPVGKAPRSMMSLDCVTAILDAIIKDSAPSHQESVQALRDNMDFRKYVMGVALQRIQQIQDKGICDGLEAGDSNKIRQLVCSLGSAFLKHYSENQKPEEEGKRNRSKGICGQCLEGLVSIMTILTQQHKDQLAICLCNILGAQDPDNHQEVIYSNIKKFQRLVMNLLSVEEDDHNWKEVAHLLTIIQLLCRELTSTNGQFEKVLDWIHKICTEKAIDDLSTCKLLFGMLLEMTQQRKSCPPYLRDISQDIHTQLGDIDQDVEVEDRTHHASVTARTAAPTILLLVLQQVERELDDTEWAIARIKANILSETPNDDADDLTQREGHEKSICSRVGILVTAFHELIQSAVPVGVCVEAMIKQATRLFGTLTLLVKYYLAMYAQKAHHVTARFEKLIKLTGTHLTQHCYAMITYIQTSESEHIQHTVEKHGKKDKKKASAAAQAGRAKVMKQSRTIPNLIFAIETFEKFLIQLSKKSKINLMEHIKISTSRDFRINTAAVQEVMAEVSGSDSEGEDSNGNAEDDTVVSDNGSKHSSSEEDQENQEPANKRPCLDQPAIAAKTNKLVKNKKMAIKK